MLSKKQFGVESLILGGVPLQDVRRLEYHQTPNSADSVVSSLFSHFFFYDGQFPAIVSASGANGVIDMPCAAVGAYSQCGGYSLIVGSAFEGSRFGLSSFRMCHFL